MWYYFEDKEYLKPENLKKLGNPVIILSLKELEENLKDILQKNKSVISPFLPPDNIKHLFIVKTLPNLYSPFTKEEYDYLQGIKDEKKRKEEEKKILSEKLGLSIYKPEIKLSELGGMKNLKRYVDFLKTLEKVKDRDLEIKGIFLVGIAGTGKSYSVKAVAGELGRYLVELNLSKIMESPNPVYALHKIFQFLEKISSEKENMKFILWVDEIEKMFASLEGIEKKVLGQLLTIINDLNTPEGYKINAFFWATANDIKQMLERNPEFIRSGRFDKLFFVDTPCYPDEAIEIFKIYFKKFNLPIPENPAFWNKLVSTAQNVVWKELVRKYGDPKANVFVYTPAEIMQTTKEVKRDILLLADKLLGKLDSDFSKSTYKILDVLNELAELEQRKMLNELLRKKMGETVDFYKKFIEYIKSSSDRKIQPYEKILLALFYQQFFNVNPLLKSARKTITDMRGLKQEYFTPVSDCSI